MKKNIIYVTAFIISLCYLCCTSNEGKFTELERDLLTMKIKSMQLKASESIENKGRIMELFKLTHFPKEMASFAYAMVMSPDGKIMANNEPLEIKGIPKDEATRNVLKYRDSSNMLIQELKYNDSDVLDISLPVFSSTSPDKYIGAVRFAIYTD